MENLFGDADIAYGYAHFRPAVHPRIIERIRSRMGLGKVRRVLDAGCGAGLSTGALAPIAEHRFGIEPAESMLRWISRTAPGASFVVGTAERLPFRSGSMDLITAAGSLNYTDARQFFDEAERVLVDGGCVVVYDFSAGRSFAGSGELDAWYSEFETRYPPAQDGACELDPASLAELAPRFDLSGSEQFQIGVPLDFASYLEYVLTETNVAWAVRNGDRFESIRGWCAGTLRQLFRDSQREVLFGGYIAYMAPRARRPR